MPNKDIKNYSTNSALKILLALTIIHFLIWVTFADIAKVPSFLLAIVYPYDFASKAFGGGAVYLLVLFQFIVVSTLFVNIKRKSPSSFIAPALLAIWFFVVNIVLLVAHIH